jgi:beta-N-acetylhexosaminidase
VQIQVGTIEIARSRRVPGPRALVIAIAITIAGCGGGSPTPTNLALVPTPSPLTSQSPAPASFAAAPTAEPTPTTEPTATPVPATATPTRPPTPAPTPKPTPKPTPRPTSPPRPTGSPSPTTPPPTAAPLTLAQLVGQKLVIRIEGTTPSAGLLARIRRGEIGGVILFGDNITTAAALVELTSALQAAASAGGQPPLLIATDQEGGAINRISWAPPTLSAPQMGSIGSESVAQSQGAAAGSALRGLGINVDLAPVADVPGSTSSFMYLQGRTFSFSAAATTSLANAFARGLESEGVEPTMKHFPGIGFALQNTDSHAVTIDESSAQLAPGLKPYREAISERIPLVMLSNATYSAYDPSAAAGWSTAIGQGLLRTNLGFRGVTITDSLTGAAIVRGLTQAELAVRAAAAGTDLILVSGDEASTAVAYDTLLAAATDGTISSASLRASYGRILALKAGF